MFWIIFAFSGPVFWAISTHIDKYLIERYFKDGDVTILMVFTALIGLFMLPFIWWYVPGVATLPRLSIVVMVGSGVLYMGALLFYLQALQSEEASFVAPFFQAAPLFTYLLAYLVLGETLSFSQMVGGLCIVVGALLLSLRSGKHSITFKSKFIWLMLFCAFSLALSSVIFKFFAVQDEFWSTLFWTFVGEGIFGIIILLIPKYFRQFVNMFRLNTAAVLGINGANELINLGGGLGVRYATLLAPVSIVQAISSTSTLFVFVFGIILTLFFPSLGRENVSRDSILQKGIATILVVVGVIIINYS